MSASCSGEARSVRPKLTSPLENATEASKTPIRLGCDFSGLGSANIALLALLLPLGVPLEHVFASEVWSPALRFLRANFNICKIYRGVKSRVLLQAYFDLDIYVAGPPCQDVSSAGKRRGRCTLVPRLTLFIESITFVKSASPKCFILENVPPLLKAMNGEFFLGVLADLRDAGYHVSYEIMNTAHHGIPHHRPRLYIVGLRHDIADKPLCFPGSIPGLTLEDILDEKEPSDDSSSLPVGAGASFLVRKAQLRAARDGYRGGWMISERLSRRWGGNARPRCLCPCLPKAMSKSPFIGSRGRHLRVIEAARMQGLCSRDFSWPQKTSEIFGLLGNAMSQNVLQRIMCRILPHLHIHCFAIEDSWANGSALLKIRHEAGALNTCNRQTTLHRFWKSSFPRMPLYKQPVLQDDSTDVPAIL